MSAPLPRRILRAVALVVLLVLVPAIVGGILGGATGAAACAIGVLGGVVGSLGSGVTAMRRHLPVLAAAFALGALTTGTGWWVVLVAALGAATGWAARSGLMSLYAVSAIVAVTAKPVGTWWEALAGAAFVVGGGLLGSEVARRAGVPISRPLPAESLVMARALAVVLGLGVGVAAIFALTLGERGYWVPMTVLILAQPAEEGRLLHSRDRLVGTLAGVLVVVPLALLAPPRWLTLVAALVCLLAVLVVSSPYWLRTMLVTLTVVLLLAPPEQGIAFAEARLGTTLLGVLIVVAGATGLIAWTRRAGDAPALLDAR